MQSHHQVSGLVTACAMGDLMIVSYPIPPISVQGVVSVAKMSSEFEGKQSLQFDASIWIFHAAQIQTYTCFFTSTI